MPYRVSTGGSSIYVSSSTDPKELVKDQRWRRLGLLGLGLIVLGTVAQIVAVFLP
jgi:hypothetical protein